MTADYESATATATCAAREGLYLTFKLGEEFFGLEILKVQEIIGFQSITHVPGTPEFVRGVINLRGKVIPVVSLRLRFQMEDHETTNRTCIIVVNLTHRSGTFTLGVVVDEVWEVLELAQDQIEAPPSFGAAVDSSFLLGVGKSEQRVIMLLDGDRLFSQEEIAHVASMSEDNG